jgi:hypothetical protein
MRLRLGVASLTLALLLPLSGVSAAGGSRCAPPDSVQFGPDFLRLYAQLGDVMGLPTSCEQRSGNGDLVQATTTGVAVYRAQTGAAFFASGEQHWALTDDALVSWTGNWHQGMAPPPAAEPTEDPDLSLPAPSPSIASIVALSLVQAAADDPSAVVLDANGTLYAARTAAGCQDVLREIGKTVYVRSPGPLGSSGSELVLLDERQSCAITSMQPMPGTAAPNP